MLARVAKIGKQGSGQFLQKRERLKEKIKYKTSQMMAAHFVDLSFIYLDLKTLHFLTYYGHYLPNFLLYKMIVKKILDWGNYSKVYQIYLIYMIF